MQAFLCKVQKLIVKLLASLNRDSRLRIQCCATLVDRQRSEESMRAKRGCNGASPGNTRLRLSVAVDYERPASRREEGDDGFVGTASTSAVTRALSLPSNKFERRQRGTISTCVELQNNRDF